MHEGIRLERIAHLDVAVDCSLHPNRAVAQMADIDFDTVGVTVSVTAKYDVGRAFAPAGLFAMLETMGLKAIDGAVDDRDAAAPTAPAIADQAIRITKLLVQIAGPNQPRVIVRTNLIPAGGTEQGVIDLQRSLMAEGIALEIRACTYQQGRIFASGGPAMTRPKG